MSENDDFDPADFFGNWNVPEDYEMPEEAKNYDPLRDQCPRCNDMLGPWHTEDYCANRVAELGMIGMALQEKLPGQQIVTGSEGAAEAVQTVTELEDEFRNIYGGDGP